MKNKFYLAYLLFLLTWVVNDSSFALSTRYQKKVDPNLQQSKELEASDKAIDAKILNLNQRMARYLVLMNMDIKLMPERTELIKNKDKNYIELESYSFIQKSRLISEVVGLRYKTLRLYFSGNRVSRIETRVFEQNFYTFSKLEIVVVDPSPNTEDTKDIMVTRKFNDGMRKKVNLVAMENTRTRPLRIRFKRKYYQKNLIYFEKLYRFVEEFQNRIGGDFDKVLINDLKDSLDY